MNPTPMAQRQAAYNATAKARAKGELIKPDHCERCGKATPYVYAHHPDYARPLEVRWLCGSCHKITHIEAGDVQHWRTGRAVMALSEEQRQARFDELWRKTKSIRIKRNYSGWRVYPRSERGMTKREALRYARALALRYPIRRITVYGTDGSVERVITTKKNGNQNDSLSSNN